MLRTENCFIDGSPRSGHCFSTHNCGPHPPSPHGRGSDGDVRSPDTGTACGGVTAARECTSVALVVSPAGVAVRGAASPMSPCQPGRGQGRQVSLGDGAAKARLTEPTAVGARDATTATPADHAGSTSLVDAEDRNGAPAATESGEREEDNEDPFDPWRSRLTIGGSPLGGVGSIVAADDALCTLRVVTHQVLAHFFPPGSGDGYDGGSTIPTADVDRTREGGRGAILYPLPHQQRKQSTLPSSSEGRPATDLEAAAFPDLAAYVRNFPDSAAVDAIYPFRFLDAADARSPTTPPSHAGTGAASDSATADTPMRVLLALLGRLAGPVAVTQVLRTSMGIVTTAFMGHSLTTEQFAAAATGLSFTNLTALNIGNGFSAALDTLATQEHGRHPHSPESVAILFRSLTCTFTVYIPIAVFYFHCEPLLALMIHPNLVADTAYFLRMSVFIATPMILNNNIIKLAQSQRVTQLGVISSSVGIILLVPLLFAFRSFGISGIIAALAINRFCVFGIVLVSMLRNPGLAKAWLGRSPVEHVRAVFCQPTAFLRFVKVGLPILGANCADSWAFEALGIIAAHIGPTSAAAWNVVMAIYSQVFALHIGISAAAAIRIGNAIGAGKGLLGRRYVIATVFFSGGCTLLCVLALWIFGKTMFRLLQGNKEVTERGGEISFLAGVTFAADSMFYVMQGPFRGSGYNGVLLFIVAAGMWGCTLPLALILGVMEKQDVEGILLSLFIGVTIAFPVQIAFLLYGVHWEKYEKPSIAVEQESTQYEPQQPACSNRESADGSQAA